MSGDILALVAVILTGFGLIWYRLGKLVNEVCRQRRDIQRLETIVLNGNKNSKKRRTVSCQD